MIYNENKMKWMNKVSSRFSRSIQNINIAITINALVCVTLAACIHKHSRLMHQVSKLNTSKIYVN